MSAELTRREALASLLGAAVVVPAVPALARELPAEPSAALNLPLPAKPEAPSRIQTRGEVALGLGPMVIGGQSSVHLFTLAQASFVPYRLVLADHVDISGFEIEEVAVGGDHLMMGRLEPQAARAFAPGEVVGAQLSRRIFERRLQCRLGEPITLYVRNTRPEPGYFRAFVIGEVAEL